MAGNDLYHVWDVIQFALINAIPCIVFGSFLIWLKNVDLKGRK